MLNGWQKTSLSSEAESGWPIQAIASMISTFMGWMTRGVSAPQSNSRGSIVKHRLKRRPRLVSKRETALQPSFAGGLKSR